MPEYCRPICKFFRCGKGALAFRGKLRFCTWIEDRCRGYECTFATCARGRLLSDGICGLSLRKVTLEEPEEEELKLRVKGKLLRKIPKEELF